MGENVNIPFIKPVELPKDVGVLFDLKNISNKTLSDVKIHFKFIGKNNKVVETITKKLSEIKSTIKEIAGGTTWKGRAIFENLDKKIRNEVKEIRVWATGTGKSS